jgi:DNA (cytosine-5)-methyltransferase 1
MSGEVMRELALFAGAGGGILGGSLLGWRTICAVERDPYAAGVLIARQNDGSLPPFPVWDDVSTFDGRPWRGAVDVISGGFPCQDISIAGKGAGITGERSGLWKEMARIIGEVRPRYVFVENSPMLIHRGLITVLGDLASLGYDSRWGVLGARDVGAPHKRERLWIVADSGSGWRSDDELCARGDVVRVCGKELANSKGKRPQRSENSDRNDGAACEKRASEFTRSGDGISKNVADSNSSRFKEQRRTVADGSAHEAVECGDWWGIEPDVGRVAHGVAARVDKLRALGNGQVPSVAALAWAKLRR